LDILWAPWRMKYIEYAKIEQDSECFICKATNSNEDEKNLVVYKGESVIVLMNRYPYNTGHLLVAPTRHIPELKALTDKELCILLKTVKNSVEVIREALKPDGFNIGVNLGRVAGAGLESHVHIHVVPRWNGDTNFMPVIADAKVIPEALQDTYRRLVAHKDLFRNSENCELA